MILPFPFQVQNHASIHIMQKVLAKNILIPRLGQRQCELQDDLGMYYDYLKK